MLVDVAHGSRIELLQVSPSLSLLKNSQVSHTIESKGGCTTFCISYAAIKRLIRIKHLISIVQNSHGNEEAHLSPVQPVPISSFSTLTRLYGPTGSTSNLPKVSSVLRPYYCARLLLYYYYYGARNVKGKATRDEIRGSARQSPAQYAELSSEGSWEMNGE